MHNHYDHNSGISPEELTALVRHMLEHNQHHTEGLSQLAQHLESTPQQRVQDAIRYYEAGNEALRAALEALEERYVPFDCV